MPGNLFNLGRYFKKDQQGQTPPPKPVETSQTTAAYSEEKTTASTQPYSGIGKTPSGAEPYNGIGNPPKPKEEQTTTNQTTVSQTKTAPIGSETTTVATSSQTTAPVSAIDMNKRSGMDVLTRLTQRSNQALMVGVAKAKELKVSYVDTEHILWGLLSDAQVFQIISELKVTPKQVQDDLEKNFKKGNFSGQPQFSPRVKRVLELALQVARAMHLEFISPEHIFLALSQEGEGMAAQTLVKFNLTTEALNKKITGKKLETEGEQEKKGSTIDQYCEDLTQKAREGKLDPVVGRAAEIERTIHILSRRTKNNPVLIGDAGVGKTAIVEGLAQKIARGDVPETLVNKRILQLDLMSLIAGASHRGEFEERLKNLIKEVKAASGAIILFIDEIHNMVGAGSGNEGTMDASNILKPSLARGELQTIGTTTITEYRKYIEKDPALERRFQPVQVLEPTEDQSIEMLHALRDKYEAFHKVSIPDEAIDAAVHLSKRYVGDRFLPDKAVDLIDEAGAAVRLPAISLPEEIKALQNKLTRLTNELKEAEKINDQVRSASLEKEILESKTILEEKTQAYEKKKSTTTNVVTPDTIQEIVSRWTNIPISKLTEKESDKLVNLENLIHKRIIDQDQAVGAIAEAVRRGRAGLKSGKRPIGSFIFMGPTGVGKTELAKVLAEILFGSEEMIIRLDMTEYMERHEVAKLIGAPPGYVGYDEGGQLTEAVRRHPYSVVLFDEIEKAHPDVFNILIQLLDDGRLTDNKGHTISFKNTIVICTSNIGTGLIQPAFAKASTGKQEMLSQKSNEQMSNEAKDHKDKKQEEVKKPEDKVSKASDQTPSNQTSLPPQQDNFDFEALANKLLEELRKFFRPELLNRFDEVIVFRPLALENMLEIVNLQTKQLAKLLEDQGLGFQITPPASEKLATLGFDPIYGARPLRRTIQRYIENPISTLLIKGEAKVGDSIVVDLTVDEFSFTVKKIQPLQSSAPTSQPNPNEEKSTKPTDQLNNQPAVDTTEKPEDKTAEIGLSEDKPVTQNQTSEPPVNGQLDGQANQPAGSPLAGFYTETNSQQEAVNSTAGETPQPVTPKTA